MPDQSKIIEAVEKLLKEYPDTDTFSFLKFLVTSLESRIDKDIVITNQALKTYYTDCIARINKFLTTGCLDEFYSHTIASALALILECREETAHAVMDRGIRSLMLDGRLTLLEVLNISPLARRALSNADIRDLINRGILTTQQVLDIRYNSVEALESAAIRELLEKNILSVPEVLKVSAEAKEALLNDDIRAAVSKGALAIQQVLTINRSALEALTNPTTRALVHQVFPILEPKHFGFAWQKPKDSTPSIGAAVNPGIAPLPRQ